MRKKEDNEEYKEDKGEKAGFFSTGWLFPNFDMYITKYSLAPFTMFFSTLKLLFLK